MDTRPCDNCGKFTVFALCDACKAAEHSAAAPLVDRLTSATSGTIRLPDTKTCDECGVTSVDGRHQPWCWTLLQAKVAGILERGIRQALDLQGREPTTGLPVAPVAVVGAERQTLASYDRALDASLQAGHQSLKEIGEQSGLTVADVLRLAHEALAENRDRLGRDAARLGVVAGDG